MDKLNIHIRLKKVRKELQLNQSEIAADLSIQQKTISEIENGKIINIPNTYIYYFYKKGISLDWLYDNKGTMMEKDKVISRQTDDGQMQLNMLFEQMQSNSSVKTVENPKSEVPSNSKAYEIMYERLIDSKDLTISSLLTFVKTQENNLEFLKELVNRMRT